MAFVAADRVVVVGATHTLLAFDTLSPFFRAAAGKEGERGHIAQARFTVPAPRALGLLPCAVMAELKFCYYFPTTYQVDGIKHNEMR